MANLNDMVKNYLQTRQRLNAAVNAKKRAERELELSTDQEEALGKEIKNQFSHLMVKLEKFTFKVK